MTCKTDEHKFAYLELTDAEDGQRMLIRADVSAIFTEHAEKQRMTTLHGETIRESLSEPRTVVIAEGYRWRVMESVQEVWDKLYKVASL